MVIATVEQPSGPPPRTLAARRLFAAGPAAWRTRPAGSLAVLFGLLGVGYRLILLLAEVPPANSDEATSGLVAMHVAQGREFPLFFYGQHYMGALESYLAAPLFAAFGPSTLALRLPNLLLYAAFLALMWHLTRRLYSPWLATFTVGLLALGSDRIVKNQLLAGGGYPEVIPAGALLVLLAVNLGVGAVRRRTLGYAGWGLVAGLTLWDDWLILPYVGAAGLLLLATGWRDLRGRAGLGLAAGLVVGLIPIVWHNLTAAPADRSLAIYTTLSGAELPAPWPDRLYGGVLFGLPMGTGHCGPGHCAPWQMWWGVAFPVLLIIAGVLAALAVRRSRGDDRVRQGGRLVLVAAAALSLLAYASSSAAARTPEDSARYLSGLLISIPAVLWPLWSAAARRADPLRRLAGAAGLAALVVTMVVATGALVAAAPGEARRADQRRDLVAALDRLGVSRFYSEYWTCNNLTLLTRERLVCAVLGDDLHAGWDRYLPYRDAVDRADRPAYVLPAGSQLSRAVAAHLRDAGAAVTSTTAADYDIYQPTVRADLPLR
jgi:hypothetical protein